MNEEEWKQAVVVAALVKRLGGHVRISRREVMDIQADIVVRDSLDDHIDVCLKPHVSEPRRLLSA